VSRAASRVRQPGTFTCARCPAVTAGLDAVPEAYHNPAAVWWGAFAASAVIRDQVVMPTRSLVSSVNSASDRIPAWKVYGVRASGPHGDGLPSFSRDLNMFVTRTSDGRGGLQ
jgi:hypothetical protein